MIGEQSYRVAYSPIVVSGLARYPNSQPLWRRCLHMHSRAGKYQRPSGGVGSPGELMTVHRVFNAAQSNLLAQSGRWRTRYGDR